MKRSFHVLLTGVGSPAAAGVIDSLRTSDEYEFTITGIDCSRSAAGFHLADRHRIGPRASEPGFVPFILELCARERIDMVFSLVTDELIALAGAREQLAQVGTRLALSSASSLRKAIHKGRLFDELRQAGMAVPGFRVVRSVEEWKKAMLELGYPARSVCFKPTMSDGSRGFHIVDANVDRLRGLFGDKPNSAYVSEEELFRLIGGRHELPETMIMEFLPGEEYSIDVLVDNGCVIVAVPRLREATAGGITTRGIIREDRDVIEYAAAVVGRLGLHGNIGVQVRRDGTGVPKILEVNPRIQGTIVHCTAAGVNLPVLAVKLAFGLPIKPSELAIRWGTRMIRYWKEVFYDVNGSSYAF